AARSCRPARSLPQWANLRAPAALQTVGCDADPACPEACRLPAAASRFTMPELPDAGHRTSDVGHRALDPGHRHRASDTRRADTGQADAEHPLDAGRWTR